VNSNDRQPATLVEQAFAVPIKKRPATAVDRDELNLAIEYMYGRLGPAQVSTVLHRRASGITHWAGSVIAKGLKAGVIDIIRKER